LRLLRRSTPSRFSRVRLLTAAPRRGSSRCSAPRARLSSRRRSSPTPLTRSTRWPPDRKSSHLIFSSPSQSPLTSRPGYGGRWSSAVAPGGPFSLSADRTLGRAWTTPSERCSISTSRQWWSVQTRRCSRRALCARRYVNCGCVTRCWVHVRTADTIWWVWEAELARCSADAAFSRVCAGGRPTHSAIRCATCSSTASPAPFSSLWMTLTARATFCGW